MWIWGGAGVKTLIHKMWIKRYVFFKPLQYKDIHIGVIFNHQEGGFHDRTFELH